MKIEALNDQGLIDREPRRYDWAEKRRLYEMAILDQLQEEATPKGLAIGKIALAQWTVLSLVPIRQLSRKRK